MSVSHAKALIEEDNTRIEQRKEWHVARRLQLLAELEDHEELVERENKGFEERQAVQLKELKIKEEEIKAGDKAYRTSLEVDDEERIFFQNSGAKAEDNAYLQKLKAIEATLIDNIKYWEDLEATMDRNIKPTKMQINDMCMRLIILDANLVVTTRSPSTISSNSGGALGRYRGRLSVPRNFLAHEFMTEKGDQRMYEEIFRVLSTGSEWLEVVQEEMKECRSSIMQKHGSLNEEHVAAELGEEAGRVGELWMAMLNPPPPPPPPPMITRVVMREEDW